MQKLKTVSFAYIYNTHNLNFISTSWIIKNKAECKDLIHLFSVDLRLESGGKGR